MPFRLYCTKRKWIKDYIGGFIITAGIGAKEYAEKLKEEGDDYACNYG